METIPLKTVKSSILDFPTQLEDDEANTAQKGGNLQFELHVFFSSSNYEVCRI